MRRHRISGLLLLVATLLSMSGLAAAQTYNAASDFSASQNPTPKGWSYGQTTSRGSLPFLPFLVNYSTYDGLDIWTNYGTIVFHNATTTIVKHDCCNPLPPGGLGLHPGYFGENAVVRWTAPAKGLYKVTATFSGLDFGGQTGTTTDVAVLHTGSNGTTQLFAGDIVGFGCHDAQSFSGTVSVLAGDTIDFTVGYGGDGNFDSDGTVLDAVITAESQVLTTDVTNLISGSNLSQQQKSQLNALRSAIVNSLASGNKTAAIRDLKTLVLDVGLLMWSTPSLVPAALGDRLITDANEAIAMLSS